MLLYIIPVRFRHLDMPCRIIKLPMYPSQTISLFLGPGRRNRVVYPPERMQDALIVVHAGMGIRAAALAYGVPRSTLQDRVKQNNPALFGGQTVFQPMEERVMAQNIALLID